MQACLAGIAFDASLLFVDEMPICLLVPVVWFFCVSYRHSPCNRPTASPLAILCACAYSVSCLIVPFSLFVSSINPSINHIALLLYFFWFSLCWRVERLARVFRAFASNLHKPDARGCIANFRPQRFLCHTLCFVPERKHTENLQRNVS